MEKEENGLLPFLDILVSREGNRLGHKVYKKHIPTEEIQSSPHLKRGIIKTLADRARTICQPNDLRSEMKHLHKAFQENGYSEK